MPDGTGVELLKKIKEQNPVKPKVFFLTGFNIISLEEAYDLGVEAVFPKPVNFEALVEVVTHSLTPKKEVWKRKYERTEGCFNVELSLENSGKIGPSSTVNIGRGGMFLQINKFLPKIKEKVFFNIQFEDKDWPPIEGEGLVRWVRENEDENLPKGIGVEFSHFSENSLDHVLNLVNSLKTKSFIPKA